MDEDIKKTRAEEQNGEKRGRDFQLNMNSQLKKIPDYGRVPKNNGKHKKKRRMTVFVKIMLAVIIIGISVFLALGIIFSAQEIFGINKEDKTVLIEIPMNSGVSQIADILEDSGVIGSSEMFRVYYKLAKLEGNFQYGTYSLNQNMSYDRIVQELSKYSQSREEVSVTFPEGLGIYEMAELLEEKKVCDAEEFLTALNTTDFGYDFEKEVSSGKNKFHRMEGYAFPDTYFFFVNDNPVNVAKKLVKNFNDKMTDELWQKMKAQGLTLEETITIASIVQAEAGRSNEMRRVASVYRNRLDSAGTYPKLQADPTRGYSEEIRSQMDIIDQEIVDAYNTYEGEGLPPGPICNPGMEAIKAVLDPEETDYFYFCTNLDAPIAERNFYYAKTLKEHNNNLYKAGLK